MLEFGNITLKFITGHLMTNDRFIIPSEYGHVLETADDMENREKR